MSSSARPSRAGPRWLLFPLVLALAIALLASCAGAAQPASESTEAPGQSLGHVHGLGVDPGDGRVYVATHRGLYRIGATSVEKVGESPSADRDLMGFVVAGPGVFLASGHPSRAEGTPDPLGLVRSRDGGRSWEPVGLSGEVDFHGLEHLPGAVYGVDADGVLRMSNDGGSRWAAWSTPPALDVAADPQESGRVVLAVAGGVAWAFVDPTSARPPEFAVEPAPQLVYLSWAVDGALYGLAPDSRLYASLDGGTTWLPQGVVPGGRPHAVAAVGQGRVLAATAGGIHESRDGGRTFTTLFEMPS